MYSKEDFFKEELKKITKIFDDFYNYGYMHGRHKCRRKYVESGYLIIDPEKKEQLLKDCEDPCKYCEYYEPAYKKGCTLSTSCKQKEKQFNALEIKKYFLDHEPIYSD